MIRSLHALLLGGSLFLIQFVGVSLPVRADANAEAAPLVLAHYMPWYGSKPVSGKWGWHWTMDHFDPDVLRWDGRREVASHDYPLIGLYDSGDPDALECQVLQMKLAGIDGVIIDWYGIEDFNDYARIHQNTQALIPALKKAGLKFAICYEDQSIGQMVERKRMTSAEAVDHGKEVMQWLDQQWFADDAYVKLDGRPLLLVFGPQYFERDDWQSLFVGLDSPPLVHALPHLASKVDADGAFGWPPVAGGKTLSAAAWKENLASLYARTETGASVVAVAFPGFQDIYRQAGLHDSYGFIGDGNGTTFADTLELAWKSGSPVVQVATWNDYGEGTVIEPTEKLGYRYLEAIQERTVTEIEAGALRLPAELYRLRKGLAGDPGRREALDRASDLLFAMEISKAGAAIAELSEALGEMPASFEGQATEADSDYRLVKDLLYREGDDLSDAAKRRCRLDVYYPDDGRKHPAVVWFHGGGISKGSKSVPVPLRNQGVIVIAANYRLSPGVSAPLYVEDAAAAVAWAFENIEEFGGRADSIFVSGHSAGGYLASMVGLDPKYLKAHGIDANQIAGLVPFSGHTITHFTVRKERGIDGKQAVVDEMAPLFHARKDAPPILLITGDRELELLARYEENAYFWRMMQEVGHPDTELAELEGFDHGKMPEPAFPLLLRFMDEHSPAK